MATLVVAQSPSPPPTRLTAGASTDGKYGPLSDSGFGNPFFYHQFADDFDNQFGSAGLYTTTLVGTGVAAAHAAGDGGTASFVTGATASSSSLIQLPAASFSMPGQSTVSPYPPISVKKLFYLVRLQLSDVTLTNFIAGLCNTGATFTAGAPTVTEGVYFSKAAGGTQITLTAVASAGNSPSGSGVSYVINVPTSAYNLVASTYIDLSFSVDRFQNINVSVGNPLMVGYAPQSGSGAVIAATGVTQSPPRGPSASFNQSFWNQAVTTSQPPYYWTLANLNMTLGVSNGVTAVTKTMIADFHCAQKER